MLAVFIDAEREGYEPNQVEKTMTLGELADVFAQMAKYEGDDVKVFLRHDGGYTYGGINLEYAEVIEIEGEE